jgi:hypothetical protein
MSTSKYEHLAVRDGRLGCGRGCATIANAAPVKTGLQMHDAAHRCLLAAVSVRDE